MGSSAENSMAILRSALIALSRNRPLRHFSEHSSLGRRMSSRFVAGMEIEDAMRAAKSLQDQGIASTLDSLGENVTTPDQARRSADIYHRLLDQIAVRELNANVSIKLTQMGMALDPVLCAEIVSSLVNHAAVLDNFVRIDMEGTEYTQDTLDLIRFLHAQPLNRNHVGVVVQAYLYRSAEDIASLVADGIRIRLCKGAYKEPPAVAFPKKSEVDANYIRLVQTLLASGIHHAIATHDPAMIAAAKRFVQENSIPKTSFEFQMLYGIRRDLQRSLVTEGYNLRVYTPFGSEWYPYFMRRLAERPANLFFLAKNLLKQ